MKKLIFSCALLFVVLVSCDTGTDETEKTFQMLEEKANQLEFLVSEQETRINELVDELSELTASQSLKMTNVQSKMENSLKTHMETVDGAIEAHQELLNGSSDILINTLLGKYKDIEGFVGATVNHDLNLLEYIFIQAPDDSDIKFVLLEGTVKNGSEVYTDIWDIYGSAVNSSYLTGASVPSENVIVRKLHVNIHINENTVLRLITHDKDGNIKTLLLNEINDLPEVSHE